MLCVLNAKHIMIGFDNYALMYVEELRHMLMTKDNLIKDLQECLARSEMEISRLQRIE